ncbi:unnamed protein product [Sphenostylis stenocarpa]|uniref:Uncharacterized protein n=1 Tax=Sphenostylis stenocarpa TaxID=92480 RepID=A0AA86S2Y5_9FABA|nr:unnamed protein product [Sphenostylis stenocarpa]
MSSGDDERLIRNEALAYCSALRYVFRDKTEKYEAFLEITKGFKARRVDVEGVIARMKELLKGHNDLLLRFNTFLPSEYQITLSLDDDLPPRKRGRTMHIKSEEEEELDRSLTETDRNQRHGAKEKNHGDYDRDSTNEEHLSKKRKSPWRDEESDDDSDTTFGMHPDSSSLKKMKRSWEVGSTSSQLKKPLVSVSSREFTGRPQMRSGRGQKITMSDAMSYLKAVKVALRDKKEKYIEFMEVMKDVKDERIDITCLIAKLKELFKGNKDLILRFNKFLSKEYKITLSWEDEQLSQHTYSNSSASVFEDPSSLKGIYNRLLDYLKEVNKKLQNPEDFQKFLKYLHIYSMEIINRQELQLLVSNLLEKYADLIEGFAEFLAQHEKSEGLLAVVLNERHEPESLKVEDRDPDPQGMTR